MRRPARYYTEPDGRTAAQTLAFKEVSSRLRLTLVDLLRVILRDGADAQADDITDYAGVLLGFDPVAIDSHALDILRRERRTAGVMNTLDAPHIELASKLGLGRRRVHEIDQIVIGPRR